MTAQCSGRWVPGAAGPCYRPAVFLVRTRNGLHRKACAHHLSQVVRELAPGYLDGVAVVRLGSR